MRKVIEYVAKDGTVTYRVRYRSGGRYTSETFRRKPDAQTFASLLTSSVEDALAWLHSKDAQQDTATFAEWFDAYVNQLTGVEPRTRDDYHAMHRRYLTHLDHLPLTLITRKHVTDTVNAMDQRGLAPKTIKNAVNMLSSVLALAVEDGHIARNPCRKIRLPKAALDDHEIIYLAPDEFAALLERIPEHYRPLVFTLGGTGMRWSEATALQGQHIIGNTARVRQAWKRVKGEGWRLGPPKTAKSRRTITLPANVVTALPKAKRGEFVFQTTTGRPVRHSNFYNRIWVPACAAAGLDPSPGIHSLRHSHVAWLIAAGTPLPVIQARLGHEKITTTIDTYGHLLPDLHAAAAEVAEVALGFLPELTAPAALEPAAKAPRGR